MLFSDFAKYLDEIEKTSKRLEITSLLSKLISSLGESEAKEATYLSLGNLKAPFENVKTNIAEKMMIKMLENTYSTPQKIISESEISQLFNQLGDLGNVAQTLAEESKVTQSTLTVLDVYNKIYEVSYIEGTGSQDLKSKKVSMLLKELDPVSVKFAVRTIIGNVRLGFTELTLVAALALSLGDKQLADEIEKVYSVHPDIGKIVKTGKTKGIEGIRKIEIETGTPVLCQRAQRYGDAYETIEKMGTVWAEYKFDGTRTQLHLDKGKPEDHIVKPQEALFSTKEQSYMVRTFSRKPEENTHQFPDLVEAAKTQIKATSVILDGEVIGFDAATGSFKPFNETMQRKRKHDIAEMAKSVPIKFFVFDILLCDGKSLVNASLRERKEILKKVIGAGDILVVDNYFETSDGDELYNYFAKARDKGLEGLIAKKPEDPYQAGARSYSWVKLKKADEKLLEDSIDGVILGYSVGRGARSEFGIGKFLVGIFDETTQTYKTLTKVGTGLTEETLIKLKEACDKIKTAEIPKNVEMNKIYTPDVFVSPSIVVEIGGDELSESETHSSGFGLRFPRLLKIRDDKKASDATTLDEISNMFKHQKVGQYN